MLPLTREWHVEPCLLGGAVVELRLHARSDTTALVACERCLLGRIVIAVRAWAVSIRVAAVGAAIVAMVGLGLPVAVHAIA